MIDVIKKDLEKIYKNKPNRLKHVYGVLDTALSLGKRFDLDLDKLTYAALLHDITKYYDNKKQEEIIRNNYKNYQRILEEFNSQILHSFTAVIYAKEVYNIVDDEILNSISSHTVGRPNMSRYEEIVFISDYIEPNRTYDSCIKVRKIANQNLQLAVYTAIDDSIKYYEKEHSKIPKQAYDAREFYEQLLEENHGKN